MFDWLKSKSLMCEMRSVIGIGLILFLVAACTNGSMGWVGRQYMYGFNFSAVRHMRNIEIQDCEFQTVRPGYGIRCRKFDGYPLQQHGQAGLMYPPSFLIVQWIDTNTHKSYQAKADLKAGMPKDFKYQDLNDITFVCDRDLLEVFLISKRLRPSDWPIDGPYSIQNETGERIYFYDIYKVYKIASVKADSK
jgi:hypothetical protein